jgi:hypothetical protein
MSPYMQRISLVGLWFTTSKHWTYQFLLSTIEADSVHKWNLFIAFNNKGRNVFILPRRGVCFQFTTWRTFRIFKTTWPMRSRTIRDLSLPLVTETSLEKICTLNETNVALLLDNFVWQHFSISEDLILSFHTYRQIAIPINILWHTSTVTIKRCTVKKKHYSCALRLFQTMHETRATL